METKVETKSFPPFECFIYAPFTIMDGNEALVRVETKSYIYSSFGFHTRRGIFYHRV